MSSKQWIRSSSHLSPANVRGPRTPPTNNHGLPVSPALQSSEKLPARELQPLDSFTSFRKTVAANSHANALATPVRQCNFTAARLPSHYLLPFTTVFRREKDDRLVPYLAPVEEPRQASRSYILNSRQLLDRLGQKKTWQRLLGHDLKFGLKNRNDYRWPADADHIILSQLRSSLIRKLSWVLNKPNLVVSMYSDKDYPSSASILHLRTDSKARSRSNAGVTEYQLSVLLGEEALTNLLKSTRYVESDALVLAQSYMTMSAHAALARLSMFMSPSGTLLNSPKT
ncbi:hypothetical protein AUEXF2481DRAFT_367434 [Aureobasidium subglaciale EXF-2481]|uniref:Uncharacterized protein n=1 Tax=Aureobasidium subglaciale (strain EXF-2481) TaxID=1043005 RepID=A0A074Y5F2_AURSE|nr:uncharacterized protein AUEXF2481DRAFT_367434 [Aureobasidium subglaciale EXF-2481]KEQ92960.1 hypothetical protein AUEXF2481DRAFT_367434 [Aureobasidium subglaciale EXF-2481]